jgi:hypothetical protein
VVLTFVTQPLTGGHLGEDDHPHLISLVKGQALSKLKKLMIGFTR